MWWNKTYFNKRDWLLENMKSLKLNAMQVVLLQVIDYLNQEKQSISHELLTAITGMSAKDIDQCLESLIQLGMLNIELKDHILCFNLDGLFNRENTYAYVNEDIFQTFETEFGRLLSQAELSLLNEWLMNYTQDEILNALKSALVYQKTSMKYIERILVNQRKEQAL